MPGVPGPPQQARPLSVPGFIVVLGFLFSLGSWADRFLGWEMVARPPCRGRIVVGGSSSRVRPCLGGSLGRVRDKLSSPPARSSHRTHPVMRMSAASGYVLSGIKISDEPAVNLAALAAATPSSTAAADAAAESAAPQ